MPQEQNDSLVSRRHRNYLIAYHVFLAIFLSAALAALIAFTPSMPASSEPKNAADDSTYRLVIIATLVAMFVAGAAGGTLCNLCNDELLDFLKDNRSAPSKEIDFYLRPLRGAVTGLLAFFLGNLLVTSLSINATEQSWATLTGRLPYIAVAILAGYASPEFMFRLKEVAKTVFAKNDNDQSQNNPQDQQKG